MITRKTMMAPWVVNHLLYISACASTVSANSGVINARGENSSVLISMAMSPPSRNMDSTPMRYMTPMRL